MLCTAVSIGLEHKYLTPDKPIVILPSGGYCKNVEEYDIKYPTIEKIVEYYLSTNRKEHADYIKEKYYQTKLSQDDIDDILITRENNGDDNKEISEEEKQKFLESTRQFDLTDYRKDICKDNYILNLRKYYSNTYGFKKIDNNELLN